MHNCLASAGVTLLLGEYKYLQLLTEPVVLARQVPHSAVTGYFTKQSCSK